MRRFLCCSAGGARGGRGRQSRGMPSPGRGRIQRHRRAAAQPRPRESIGDPRAGGSAPSGCARGGVPALGVCPGGALPALGVCLGGARCLPGAPSPPAPARRRAAPGGGISPRPQSPPGWRWGFFQDRLFFARKLLARRRFRCDPGGTGKEPLYKPLPRSPCCGSRFRAGIAGPRVPTFGYVSYPRLTGCWSRLFFWTRIFHPWQRLLTIPTDTPIPSSSRAGKGALKRGFDVSGLGRSRWVVQLQCLRNSGDVRNVY